MESWVGTLFKDIGEKVGFSGPSSTTLFTLLSRENEVEDIPTNSETSIDYFPSRLSPPELLLLIQYVLQMELLNAGHDLNNILGRLLFMEHLASERVSSAPCLAFDMSKKGHACITAPLGEKAWPPEVSYTFVYWFRYRGLKSQQTEHQTMKLKLFSLSSTDNESTLEEELYLQEDGVLTFAINSSSSLSFPSLELEEGVWYHLAIVRSKRIDVATENLSGTVQSVHIYLNGKLSNTGELAYTPMLVKRELQIIIGTPANHARVSDLQWELRSCYLFQEPLSAEIFHFMYMLAKGCKVIVQGLDDSHSTFNEDGGGERFSTLDSSLDSGTGSLDTSDKLKRPETDGSETIWDMEMLENLWLQLFKKKLLCAFNAARIEALPASHTLTLPNLVDPMSAAAPPTGIPRFGHFYGDVSICRRCIIGKVMCPVTGIAVILALIETAKTSNMLHIALTLLASVLQRNPHRVEQMKACKGYELLSLYLQRKMSLFDVQCLEILFKIAVAEDPLKLKNSQTVSPSAEALPLSSSLEVNTAEFLDRLSPMRNHGSIHDFSPIGKTSHSFDHVANTTAGSLISNALSDADIIEYVLLDWTLWVIAPVFIQLEILNFLENLITVYKYKDHNLTVLRERKIVHHVLAALRRDDVEMLVLEKFVILLGVILQHEFLDSELESVATFMLTTFDPPEVMKPFQITREEKSKRLTMRNILLETLVDLQVTIFSEELLEKWHEIVSSKLIKYFLDEAVHPTSMIWIITHLGLCLTSSPGFPIKFESSGGYQALARVLPRFHDFLDIYFTLFCLIFGKPIYPKLPEVGILDFEALMLSNEDFGDLKFAGLLDSVIAMVKVVFDQIKVQPNLALQAAAVSQASAVDLAEENIDIIEVKIGEEVASHTTHAAVLHGWEASATNATSVLRFMANFAKMSPSFSIICDRTGFLESCVDLYFSIVRAYMAMKLTREPNVATTSTGSSILASEGDEFPSTKSGFQKSSTEHPSFMTTSHLMLEIDSSGYSGEPSSIGGTAILDLIAEVLSITLIEHTNPVATIENLLESVPLYLDSESVLTFRALCLTRVMNYLERRLLQSDETHNQRRDKNNLWSNLGSFCNLIVDCVLLGVFPRPSAVMRVLEFCLLMLHSVKKDYQTQESSMPWTGLVSILRGSKPIDVIYKSTNSRMVLYCFLPSFLASIEKDPLISQEEIRIDICLVLELIHAHKEIIFHPSNVDTDLYCSLCINLIARFSDQQTDARNAAMSILKYLLVHSRASLEDVLISKPGHDKKILDVLNGGFDKLLTENMSTFMRWFQRSEHDIKRVLQQFAEIRWSQYIEESAKFRRERLELLEDHWTTKMGRKVEHATKLDIAYWDQCIQRRSTLSAMTNVMSTELELGYEKKRELVHHAENEWRSHFEQLGHEHKGEIISSLVWEDYWPL